MPTINQLIRKPRKVAARKSKSPALGSIVNTLKTRYYDQPALSSAAFALKSPLKPLKSQTQRFVKLLVSV